MKPQKLWFVVHTKPGQEETVAMHLKHKGIETYLPKIETCTYNGLKKLKRPSPFFPIIFLPGVKGKTSLRCVGPGG
jgi:Transcription termination factor nusG.